MSVPTQGTALNSREVSSRLTAVSSHSSFASGVRYALVLHSHLIQVEMYVGQAFDGWQIFEIIF